MISIVGRSQQKNKIYNIVYIRFSDILTSSFKKKRELII